MLLKTIFTFSHPSGTGVSLSKKLCTVLSSLATSHLNLKSSHMTLAICYYSFYQLVLHLLGVFHFDTGMHRKNLWEHQGALLEHVTILMATWKVDLKHHFSASF